MKKQLPDEAERIQQAILEREVEEELQKERLMNFWKKYRFVIIGGLFLIISFTVGTEIYKSWYNKIRIAESNQFEQAVLFDYTSEPEKASQLYSELSQNARTGYQYLAQMRLAQMAFGKNDTSNGIQILTNLMNNSAAPEELRDVARLSVIGHQVGTTDSNELLKLLQPLLKKQNSFYASAVELQAILLLEQKKNDEASQILNTALGLPTLSEQSKNRLKELLSIIQ